jgi:rfaE bifunctional protein nucleotidyltransferase chain/domain
MNNRILTAEQASELAKAHQSKGKKVVFTNGVFDILHLGHVTYLEEAQALGDVLIVGLNNDHSVKQLAKGAERPINPELARAGVLAALRCVDGVVIFAESTPEQLIKQIAPDVLVKGGDYNPEETDVSAPGYMVGSDFVKSKGGKVVAIPLVNGYSTTNIVKKLRS